MVMSEEAEWWDAKPWAQRRMDNAGAEIEPASLRMYSHGFGMLLVHT